MTFGSVFGRTFSPTFQPKSQAAASAASTWWDLNGTITSCVAAYQPKGAASYAASKVNLTGNTAFNLSDGSAYPSWNTTTGWLFTGSSSQYLTIAAPVLTAAPITIVAKFKCTKTDEVNIIASIHDTAALNGFDLCVSNTNFVRAYIFAGGSASEANSTAGISKNVAYTGEAVFESATSRAAYLDGSNKGTNTTSRTPTGLDTTFIGVLHTGSGFAYYFDGYIESVAFYSEALSDAQIAAIHTAMNAL